jgi:hypothetical protein
VSAALKAISTAANPELGKPGDLGGDLLAQRLRAARLKASEHLLEAVETTVSVMKRGARGGQYRLMAARDLFRYCEGTLAAEPAAVDSAVRVLVVDQSQLSGELAKRVRSA